MWVANHTNRNPINLRRCRISANSFITKIYQGQMGRTASGVVTIATAGTYQATSLIGTLDTVVSNGIALSTTDQLGLRNVSGKTVDFKIFASADIEAGNNKILGIILAKNGTPIA